MNEPLMAVCIGDIAGQVRAKSIPVAMRESRFLSGVGWTPTNVQITCFDVIADSPYGSFGDVLMVPDPATELRVDLGPEVPTEHFVLADIVEPGGKVWDCCLRSMLKAALADLKSEADLSVRCTFEHEFMFKREAELGRAYSLGGLRARKRFGELMMGALRQAGLKPDAFLKEYGVNQYEVTVEPAVGLAAADQALIVRELVRLTALAMGESVTFTPLRAASGVGNGVHVHISLLDRDGNPATYDSAGSCELSASAGTFVAGILKYLAASIAIFAPSAISYTRLTPHRWSAAFNNLGYRDREAAIRICPGFGDDPAGRARQMNFEFRATDAAANPHLVLATLVRAGLEGIREKLPTPQPTSEDLSQCDILDLERRGIVRLPTSLDEALTELALNRTVRSWFPQPFVDIYLAHKRGELAVIKDLTKDQLFDAYANAY
jgi:glutamine synthetase